MLLGSDRIKKNVIEYKSNKLGSAVFVTEYEWGKHLVF
jgi:hypothetical protein